MSYPPLYVPELSPLMAQFRRLNIATHLSGYLVAESEFPFVDVAHAAAERLSLGTPRAFRFICPFPASGQACVEGLADPLQDPTQDLEEILRAFRPSGFSDELFQDHFQDLVQQAKYVRQFPPSRLVLMTEKLPDDEVLKRWLGDF